MKLTFLVGLCTTKGFIDSITDLLVGAGTKLGLLDPDPEFTQDFDEIVKKAGYSFENHPVITEDDYILNVFRILDTSIKEKKGVVLLQHGILDSADAWIMNK